MGDTNDKVQKFLSGEFNLPSVLDQPDFKKALAERINELIENDFMTLVNILYRIDVSQATLKETLNSQPRKDAGQLIADLIIERQAQKIESRNQFNSDLDINEEEKW
jgi:hypothetical protein